MITADGWDLTVPEDVAELAAELRRHGVTPGQRLHIVQDPDLSAEPVAKKQRKLSFIASCDGGPSDVSKRTDDYLQGGFGQA